MLNLDVNHAIPISRYDFRSMETIGDRIKQLRIARGMTQEQLADAVGVTKSAVSQWESGSTANIKLQTFALLCIALRTDTDYLIWGPTRTPPAASTYNVRKR